LAPRSTLPDDSPSRPDFDRREAGLPAIALETATREGRFEKEGLRVRKDGSQFWANVVIDAVRNEDGTLFGLPKLRVISLSGRTRSLRWNLEFFLRRFQ
jgi:hypothetical protein